VTIKEWTDDISKRQTEVNDIIVLESSATEKATLEDKEHGAHDGSF
jgi:hypothetical protein